MTQSAPGHAVQSSYHNADRSSNQSRAVVQMKLQINVNQETPGYLGVERQPSFADTVCHDAHDAVNRHSTRQLPIRCFYGIHGLSVPWDGTPTVPR